ncbi:MAG: hypothetical protein DMF48_07550 [Verrucomicrobia bacterium]|nr:MAG: hypothetical protein DMF48_07550 [Verrucomicrobiota bacterium]
MEYSAQCDSATIFLFRIGLPFGNRAADGGAHEKLNENLYSSWRTPCYQSPLSWRTRPSRKKAFADKYKAAMEGKNIATLESFLYTRLRPRGLEFYKMMQSEEASRKFPTLTLLISRRRTLKKRRHRWTDQPAKFA